MTVQELTGLLMDAMFVFLNNVGMEIYPMFTLLGLLGLVIGSFVSVVSYRIPRSLGFVSGRSFCDTCKKELKWYDNLPLFSFLLYRGKSRCCGKKISLRYPLIEFTSALGAVLLYFQFSLFEFITLYALFSILLIILVIDIEHQIIPDELIWLTLFLGLLFYNHQSLFSNLFPAFFLSLMLLTLFLMTKGRGMGLGDVKLAIPLGLFLGLEKGIYWLMTSFILGGITASILLVLKRATLKTKIAFGPFLIIAFWIVVFYIKLY